MACIFFHKWDGCKCTKCGFVRDKDHRIGWKNWDNQGCVKICTVCGSKYGKFDHEMVQVPGTCGEKCVRCGYTRYHHRFQRVDGTCTEKCLDCGEERKAPHVFRWEKCKEICNYCGYTRPAHRWNEIWHGRNKLAGCKCTACGMINPDGEHDWQYGVTEGNYTGIRVCRQCGARDESHKMTLEEWEIADRKRTEAHQNMDEGIF